jgi:hypothetical protein
LAVMCRREERGLLDAILDQYGDEDEEARERRRGEHDRRRQRLEEEEEDQVSTVYLCVCVCVWCVVGLGRARPGSLTEACVRAGVGCVTGGACTGSTALPSCRWT